ncbi:MBL fold metallo-hydrolase [Ideonella paludis]|uniref:MBL fold metallo-hydrolase n=1 Tax=Ideonella paludis TaxID=1233411 RepID=A0ABS5DZR8_9BURK|nr:MBL fold metallo-hydrolase [Ideonella paludis]
MTVLQRDWLSSNQAVFRAEGAVPASLVDSGYARHAPMTLALLEHVLDGQPLARLLNTHLHSDHCGGNRLLQARYPELATMVPIGHWAAASQWDRSRLSYDAVGQFCERFAVQGALAAGDEIELGAGRWQVHAAPGHDMDAVMLFEPQSRTLIAGDALWEQRLAIIFPELEGGPGFSATRATLDLIERLAPTLVVPGHGAVFEDVAAALAASRERLEVFERKPERHVLHAARALLMFHLMEVEQISEAALQQWLMGTPLYRTMARHLGHGDPTALVRWSAELVAGLVDGGHVRRSESVLSVLSN